MEYLNKTIVTTALGKLFHLWSLNFAVKFTILVSTGELTLVYFGLLVTNLRALGINTLLTLYREIYLIYGHQTSYLPSLYYSPELIRFWYTLVTFDEFTM